MENSPAPWRPAVGLYGKLYKPEQGFSGLVPRAVPPKGDKEHGAHRSSDRDRGGPLLLVTHPQRRNDHADDQDDPTDVHLHDSSPPPRGTGRTLASSGAGVRSAACRPERRPVKIRTFPYRAYSTVHAGSGRSKQRVITHGNRHYGTKPIYSVIEGPAR